MTLVSEVYLTATPILIEPKKKNMKEISEKQNIFLTNRNKVWLLQPLMQADQEQTGTRCKGPTLDVSFQAQFYWPCSFRVEDILKGPNKKHELSVAAMFEDRIG